MTKWLRLEGTSAGYLSNSETKDDTTGRFGQHFSSKPSSKE